MDSNWLEWRHFERLWNEFEEQGWELGPVKYVNLPPLLAEFGSYRIMFRYWDPETEESLFDLREMYDGEEYRVVSVWGVPTPQQAETLLKQYGVALDEALDEAPEETLTEASADSESFWGELLPPVVYASESR